MQATDAKQFAEVMQYLFLNFPDREISPDLVRSYFHDLSEYDISDIEKAARDYVKSGERYPFVSDFINLLSA
ncbi:MAG: hypothetical protein HYS23_14560 [Geobacter sp.]|nr:hypothetical protein [Geobacter sp.]